MLTEKEREANARKFAETWKGRGNEKSEAQKFWIQLLKDVYGVENYVDYIEFEERVKVNNTNYIDAHISKTNTYIEQKSLGIDLKKKIKQSDGRLLTPFEQLKRYTTEMKWSKRPRWAITCNFEEFCIYDFENPEAEPISIYLKNLEKEYNKMDFLIDPDVQKINNEIQISLKAGTIVGELYNAFEKVYIENDIENYQKHLNKLCVRLVFCLYAEDSGLFGRKDMFHKYLDKKEPEEIHSALKKLFNILNTPNEKRDPFEDKEINSFPYVNGGLFSDDDLIIPYTDKQIKDLLLAKASDGFDWSNISPTIFGAVFESTLNPETRRSGGMHFTSIENIHKVIDPLFLDGLKEELKEIKKLKQPNAIKNRVKLFQEKMTSIRILDPACGSGNFLTETYLSLRRLENEALECERIDGSIEIFADPVRVGISQFFGIEINDFAVEVAKTALWIAENQMKKETERLFNIDINTLPLETNAFIVCDNALTCNWNSIATNKEISYIIGNPPFIGHQLRTVQQAQDLKTAFYDLDKHGKLDYVCGWYNKAIDYMKDTDILASFVSTNSITQGEAVSILGEHMNKKNAEIQHCYRTFIWDSKAMDKAQVHCVIICFSAKKMNSIKRIYTDSSVIEGEHINGYLMMSDDIYLQNRGAVNKKLPDILQGSKPADGGNLILSPEEREQIITKYPNNSNLIKRYIGAKDFLNNLERYCLWLKDVDPTEYKDNEYIIDRLKKVSEFRLKSPTKSTVEAARTPMLFTEIRQPNSAYLVIPSTTSENRKYIPFGYMSPEIISSNSNRMIPGAPLWMFSIMSSIVHMVWVEAVCGRLKSDYRYEPFVYYNFPWIELTNEQKDVLEKNAKQILDIREKYGLSLSELYGDKDYLYQDLIKAHQENDAFVLKIYGLNTHDDKFAILSKLFELFKH